MPSDEELSAFIDGELDETRRLELEAALALDKDLAAKVDGMRLQDQYLRQLAEPMLAEPVPERLSSVVRPPPTMPKYSERPQVRRFGISLLWRAGALAATLVLGIGVGWYAERTLTERQSLLDPFVQQAILSHRLFESNKQFDPVDSDGDTITIDAGTKPSALPVRTPTLREAELVPVMVRKVQGAPGEAIHIAYADKKGDWTTLYIRKHTNDARLPAKYLEEDGYSILYWLDGPMVYSLVGTSDEEKLRRMAEDIYRTEAMSEMRPEEEPQRIAPAVAR